MRDLVRMVIKAHPDDQFFASLVRTLRISSQVRAVYRAYDQALSCLDADSWGVLSKKAVDHYLNHRDGQLKEGFFNQLNEAFAYQFLLQRGYSSIEVLREDGTTKPDIAYIHGTTRHYCEVKSLGISDDEITRFSEMESFDNSIYQELSAGFFNKLDHDLKKAHQQISSQGASGLVFIVARFDDFTLSHYERYREQISEFLTNHGVEEVFVKVGLLGSKHVHKRFGSVDSNG